MASIDVFDFIDVLSGPDGDPPKKSPLDTGDLYENFIVIVKNPINPDKPGYFFIDGDGKGSYQLRKGKHKFGHPLGERVPYRIKITILNDKKWRFDADYGPIRFVDGSVVDFYGAELSDDNSSVILSIYPNPDEENWQHSFNLFVLEDVGGDPKPRRKIDPDVDNPPLGWP